MIVNPPPPPPPPNSGVYNFVCWVFLYRLFRLQIVYIKSVNKLTDDGFQFAEIPVFSDVSSVSRVWFPKVLGVILPSVLYPVAQPSHLACDFERTTYYQELLSNHFQEVLVFLFWLWSSLSLILQFTIFQCG